MQRSIMLSLRHQTPPRNDGLREWEMKKPKNKQGRRASKLEMQSYYVDEYADAARALAGAIRDFNRDFYAAAIKLGDAFNKKSPHRG